jgi:ATP-dependent helicase HrpB
VPKLIALAYPDRICRVRDRAARTGTMVGGGGVKIGAGSAVVDAEFFVAVDARHNPAAGRAESIVRIASRVDREWLDELFPQSIGHETIAEFYEQRQRVVGISRVYYLDLLLDEQLNAPVDDDTASRVLAEALAPRAIELIARDERASNFVARVELLRANASELGWPALDGPQLVEIVTEACRGRRAVADVATASLLDALRSRLIYPLDRKFEVLAPETLAVPTGNRLRLTYSRGDKPRMAVRLQELFGMAATPRICNGRVPVLLELLGPNYRPVQVTDDLASFWKNTYPQVRKDLRARYPKHSWPEDPLTAPPISKGRPAK